MSHTHFTFYSIYLINSYHIHTWVASSQLYFYYSIQVQVWIQRPITRTLIKRIADHRITATTIQRTAEATVYRQQSIPIKYLAIRIVSHNQISRGVIYRFSQIPHRIHRIHSKHCIHKRHSIIQHKIMAQIIYSAFWIRTNCNRNSRMRSVCRHHKAQSCIDRPPVNPVCWINSYTTNRADEEMLLHQCMTSCDRMSFSLLAFVMLSSHQL